MDNVNNNNKDDNMMSILALRLLETSKQASKGEENRLMDVNMQRILKTGVDYKFYSDVEISENEINLTYNTPPELYENHRKKDSIRINVSAIVGENGSGKSTIIDYIIRIVNNLSAVLFGEYYYNSSSEHLHYIPNVFAELYVLVDQIIFGISCKGEEIKILKYVQKESKDRKDRCVQFKKEKEIKCSNNYHTPSDKDFDKLKLLSDFCFTIIVNYSLYSFDTSSYLKEHTEDDKEIRINKKGIEDKHTSKDFEQIKHNAETNNDFKEYYEAKNWLPGILRKYDGYQVPILIAPIRENGQVIQRKEYAKGKEKLLSLALLRDEKGKRYFTHINSKEKIESITLSLNPDYARNTYLSVFKCIPKEFSETVCLALFNLVRKAIIDQVEINDSNCLYEKANWYYIVYEFFRIVMTYPEYYEYRESIMSISTRLNAKLIDSTKNIVNEICSTHSHVTRHFLRAIYYLKFALPYKERKDVPQPVDKVISRDIDINSYSENAYQIYKDNPTLIKTIDELLPSPIFNIDFKLFSEYDKDKKSVIPFETLSSGEKQITLSLSIIYYYLTQLASISDNATKNQGTGARNDKKDNVISYRHVCVIFDELELYFHPEMQRTFVNRLLMGLYQLDLKKIKSIQFIMVTHSPFILSDVPKSNVLFLDRKGNRRGVDDMHTFGANIHTMLKHSFFLDQGTMGAFAKRVIGEIEAYLDIYKIINNDNIEEQAKEREIIGFLDKEGYEFLESFFENDIKFNKEEFEKTFPKDRIKMTINLFDEPIIKKVLLNDYYEVFHKEKSKEELINTMEHQLAELKKTAQSLKDNLSLNDSIKQLENNIYELKYGE